MKESGKILGILRISFGLIFLWAFFDKLFGLGFATASDKSWIAGNSVTSGFLLNGTSGPFAEFFQSIAGNIFVEWLFMLGLLGIGIGLLFGIVRKISCYSGTIMLVLMWLAALPPKNNPVLDDHIIYAITLIYLANVNTSFSFEDKWRKLKIIKNNKFLE